MNKKQLLHYLQLIFMEDNSFPINSKTLFRFYKNAFSFIEQFKKASSSVVVIK